MFKECLLRPHEHFSTQILIHSVCEICIHVFKKQELSQNDLIIQFSVRSVICSQRCRSLLWLLHTETKPTLFRWRFLRHLIRSNEHDEWAKRQCLELIIRIFKSGFSPSVASPLYRQLIKGCPLQKPKRGVYIVPHLILQPPTPQELLTLIHTD